MELAILTLIRSFRETDFVLYCEALSDLNPYFFTNNINYARWIPVYLRDIHKWPESFTRETSWFTNLAENFQPFQFLNVGARKTVQRCKCIRPGLSSFVQLRVTGLASSRTLIA